MHGLKVVRALLEEKEGRVGWTLRVQGLTLDMLLMALSDVRGTDPFPDGKYQVLEEYCRDMTQTAQSVVFS